MFVCYCVHFDAYLKSDEYDQILNKKIIIEIENEGPSSLTASLFYSVFGVITRFVNIHHISGQH